MSSNKCKNCGCAEIDVDPARGDAVCTNCGSVLESSIIVSSVQFEENSHGGSTAIGQFVSADSKGGARGFGGSFHTGLGVESKEVTLRNAKKRITDLAHQMRLNQHCIDIAFNFFKMALSRHLTRGRKTGNVVAACVYMTCRMEGTAHMLIDFCDVMDTVGVYELGRTYLKLSQALCINIPTMDPSLYILRFANRLEFGNKTHQVSMTALRLVQRMKRDSMHTGRRPAGLCGAALLMAARLHEFNRSVSDIIKIVKVHKSTLRKRLLEFGETPSSSLSLDEFMTVDLEEEQDPPSFKAARKKDHNDRLQKIIEGDEMTQNLTALQLEIEKELREISSKRKTNFLRNTLLMGTEEDAESQELNNFIQKSTIETIEECTSGVKAEESCRNSQGLPPSITTLGLSPSCVTASTNLNSEETNEEELVIDDLDDEELNQYILTDREAKSKDSLWMKINEDYLQQQKEREEKLAKDKEEGKPERKRKKHSGKKSKIITTANTAGEAFEKMLQEKKISNKINYEVLKNLSLPKAEKEPEDNTVFSRIQSKTVLAEKENKTGAANPFEGAAGEVEESHAENETDAPPLIDDLEGDEYLEDCEPDATRNDMSLSQLLKRRDNEDADVYGEDYDEEDY